MFAGKSSSNARWKIRGSPELRSYSIPLAVKEYVSNQVKQVLREKDIRYWSNWTREDLRESGDDLRTARKEQLSEAYPGLFAGAYRNILSGKSWLPMYIVTATIPRSELKATRFNTNLDLCIVVWKHANATGITFYNNHLSSNICISHFTVEGASISSSSSRGVGFKQASQYMQEQVERHMSSTKAGKQPADAINSGVSFRIGQQVGKLEWCKVEGIPDQLGVKLDDLSPPSLIALASGAVSRPGFTRSHARSDSTDTDVLSAKTEQAQERQITAIYRRRFHQGLSTRAVGVEKATEPSHEVPLAKDDEVVVTILGLPGNLSAEYLFSGVFNLMPRPDVWRVHVRTPNSPTFHFYKPSPLPSTSPSKHKPPSSAPSFYHRDLLFSGPSVNKLGINYIGDLVMTPDCSSIVTSNLVFDQYKRHLSAAADLGICMVPELATELAYDILTDDGTQDGTIGRVLSPADTVKGKDAYRKAFQAAWRRLDPSLSEHDEVWPVTGPIPGLESALVEELEMKPCVVQPHVKTILARSGAYPDIRRHMETLLLQSCACSSDPPGTSRLKRALAMLIPGLAENQLSVRLYTHSEPTIVWDNVTDTFVMGVPLSCEMHGNSDCFCWIGPNFADAIASWEARSGSSERLAKAAIHRGYLSCMSGVDLNTMKDAASQNAPDESSSLDMHVPPPEAVAEEAEVDNDLGYVSVAPRARTPSPLPADPAYRTPISVSPRRTDAPKGTEPDMTISKEEQPARPTESQTADTGSPEVARTTPSYAALSDDPEVTESLDALWKDMRERLESHTRAQLRRERKNLQEQINSLNDELTVLRSDSSKRQYESEEVGRVLERKEQEFMELQLALQQKDEILRERDARISQLKGSLKTHCRRTKKLEGSVKRLEERDKARAQHVQSELDGIKRRISVAFTQWQEEGSETVEEDELIDDEPPTKKLRAE